jgi:hypothetical protein
LYFIQLFICILLEFIQVLIYNLFNFIDCLIIIFLNLWDFIPFTIIRVLLWNCWLLEESYYLGFSYLLYFCTVMDLATAKSASLSTRAACLTLWLWVCLFLLCRKLGWSYKLLSYYFCCLSISSCSSGVLSPLLWF